MQNSVFQLGLLVNQCNVKGEKDFNIYGDIVLEFNAPINGGSVVDNVYLLLDKDNKFNGKVVNISDYDIIEFNPMLATNRLTIKPLTQLSEGFRYIIYIPSNSLYSTMNISMFLDYTCEFFTSNSKQTKCELYSPENNSVIQSLTDLYWSEDITTNAYIIQISKFNTFEVLCVDQVSEENKLSGKFNLSNGLYYWRVKPIDGEWSDIGKFFVDSKVNIPLAHGVIEEDVANGLIGDEITFEVIETFPQDLFSNVAINLKTVYIKVTGIITDDDVDVNSILFQYESIVDDSDIYEPVDVKYTLKIVNDIELNVSYIIFSLDEL